MEKIVIIGSGPAGLFCALTLSRAGFCPLVIERGEPVEERVQAVQRFWDGGALDPNCNVQFGEGGAGTFSDGKLNTSIKDSSGRIAFVLRTFVEAGADSQILYSYKPHIGTDVLQKVVRNIRQEIIANGGTFLFSHLVEDISEHAPACRSVQRSEGEVHESIWKKDISDNGQELHVQDLHVQKIHIRDLKTGEVKIIPTQIVIAALGHSARDTFRMLYDHGYEMTPKAFAVGVRVQHPQKLIDDAMYGEDCPYEMPASPYKVTCKLEDGGGVYSFCMCPGGYVVNASSEEGRLAVNGMSYHDRDSTNANSAIVVTVSPEQYHAQDALSGIAFQQDLEEKAFQAGEGRIPTQTLGDFLARRKTTEFGSIKPVTKGECTPADIRGVFPDYINRSIEEGMRHFDRIIPGFAQDDVLLSAVESRTSSPVRIERGEDLTAIGHPCFYPCGEGAGYAGGITSAAVDGMRVAEAIVAKYSKAFIH